MATSTVKKGAVGLSTVPKEVVDYFRGYQGGNGAGMLDYYQDPTTGTIWHAQGYGGAQGQADQPWVNEGYWAYNIPQGQSELQPGDAYSMFDTSGNYAQDGVSRKHNIGKGLAMGLAAAGGMAFGLPALMGQAGAGAGAAGGIGAAAGDAGTMYAGLDAAAAGSLGGGGSLSSVAPLAGATGGGLATAGGTSGLGSTLAGGAKTVAEALGGAKGLLGPISTVVGGLAGSKGEQAEKNQNVTLPAHLQAPVSDLLGRTQGLLGSQLSDSVAQGKSMVAQGQGLLSQPIAGNGYGAVQPTGLLGSNAPNNPLGALQNITLAKGAAQPKNTVGAAKNIQMGQTNLNSNPYLSNVADDMQRRTQQLLGQNNLAIQGQSVSSGGLGGSRQGIAQGLAAGQAADSLQGQLAGLYNTAFENESNRNLSKYQADLGYAQGNRAQDISMYGMGLDSWNAQKNRDLTQYGQQLDYSLGGRGQDLTARGQDLDIWNQGQNRALQQFQGNQSFFTAQRDQDMKQTALGAGLLAQGQQAPWNSLGNAADIYGKWFGNGNTTTSASSGGGAGGALGGLLSGAGFANKMGWF